MDEESFFPFSKKGTLPLTKVEHYPLCPVGGSGFENRTKKSGSGAVSVENLCLAASPALVG